MPLTNPSFPHISCLPVTPCVLSSPLPISPPSLQKKLSGPNKSPAALSGHGAPPPPRWRGRPPTATACPSSLLPYLSERLAARPGSLSPFSLLSLYCMNNGDTFIKPRCCYEIKAPFDAPRAESVGLRASRFPLNPPRPSSHFSHDSAPRKSRPTGINFA